MSAQSIKQVLSHFIPSELINNIIGFACVFNKNELIQAKTNLYDYTAHFGYNGCYGSKLFFSVSEIRRSHITQKNYLKDLKYLDIINTPESDINTKRISLEDWKNKQIIRLYQN